MAVPVSPAPAWEPSFNVRALVDILAVRLALKGLKSDEIDELKRDILKVAEIAHVEGEVAASSRAVARLERGA